MKSLDQIRAANAVAFAPKVLPGGAGGDSISGFPALVHTDGLVATLTYAWERKGDRLSKEWFDLLVECHAKQLLPAAEGHAALPAIFAWTEEKLSHAQAIARSLLEDLQKQSEDAPEKKRKALENQAKHLAKLADGSTPFFHALAMKLKKHAGAWSIAHGLALPLRADGVAVTKAGDADGLLTELAGGDASLLRRATAESLAFLNYLKRFTE
ncbi:MAG: type III-B CRISPR module-associated protein Cmr5 [Verrucomicrobiota bacterium]